jgi:hypothetical protein
MERAAPAFLPFMKMLKLRWATFIAIQLNKQREAISLLSLVEGSRGAPEAKSVALTKRSVSNARINRAARIHNLHRRKHHKRDAIAAPVE